VVRENGRTQDSGVTIETIAVIGAGELGREMARFCLRAGYRVILEDVSETILEKAVKAVRESLAEGVSALRIDATSCEQVLVRLSTAHCVQAAVREADFIIETVAEELEMKLELFTIFDKFARPSAILASTTESLSIDDLADMTFCAERCVGMRLIRGEGDALHVQLMRGRATSGETMEACREITRGMGLRVIELHDGQALPATRD
jgi:3-hydroxybutyryl-CoA dehydrogenase